MGGVCGLNVEIIANTEPTSCLRDGVDFEAEGCKIKHFWIRSNKDNKDKTMQMGDFFLGLNRMF